jgi:hypothetical protein
MSTIEELLEIIGPRDDWDWPDESRTTNYSRKSLQEDVSRKIESGDSVIYWGHGTKELVSIPHNQNALYKQVLKTLRLAFRHNVITQVSRGDKIKVNGKKLYTMLLTMPSCPCPAYFLLKRHGDLDDIRWTPFFFRRKEDRENAIEYLTKRQNMSNSASTDDDVDWLMGRRMEVYYQYEDIYTQEIDPDTHAFVGLDEDLRPNSYRLMNADGSNEDTNTDGTDAEADIDG